MTANIQELHPRFPTASTCTGILMRFILAAEAKHAAQTPPYPEPMLVEADNDDVVAAQLRKPTP